jgi:magnesium-transporting ATPase (P-type)
MEFIQDLFTNDFINALVRFFICFGVNWVIVNKLYYKKSHRRDFYFTFLLISVAIFFLVYFMMGMDRGKATMGVGLGLFGIFSIMRYRTDTMPVREMTYLFIIVCLSVVHAMVDIENDNPNYVAEYGKLLVIDLIVLASIALCERTLKVQNTKLIQYDRPELAKPEKREELIADLEQRTGLKILKVEVGGIDFLKDSVVLRVTYDGKGSGDIDAQYTVRKSQWRNV